MRAIHAGEADVITFLTAPPGRASGPAVAAWWRLLA